VFDLVVLMGGDVDVAMLAVVVTNNSDAVAVGGQGVNTMIRITGFGAVPVPFVSS
jgi:hypothetical protein